MKRLPRFRFDAGAVHRGPALPYFKEAEIDALRVLGDWMKPVAFLLLVLATPAAADNSPIRAVSEEVHQYLSPMVLEIDLTEFLAMAPGKTWNTQAMTRFACRLVTFEYLMLTADPLAPTKVRFRSLVKNNSGKDKRVQMAFATGERCVVKVTPDAKAPCAGVLEHAGPKVRLVVTVDDD